MDSGVLAIGLRRRDLAQNLHLLGLFELAEAAFFFASTLRAASVFGVMLDIAFTKSAFSCGEGSAASAPASLVWGARFAVEGFAA